MDRNLPTLRGQPFSLWNFPPGRTHWRRSNVWQPGWFLPGNHFLSSLCTDHQFLLKPYTWRNFFFFRCNDACCLRSLWEISLYEGENEVWKWIIFCFNALQTLFLLTPNYILRKLITLDNIMHQYENNKPHYVIDEMFLTNWISLHSILSCKYFSLSKKSSLYLKLPI